MITSLSRRVPRIRAVRHWQRGFSSEVVEAKEVNPAILEGSNEKNLGNVVRHGPGDAFITLNVGGKEFYTLRSTVNSNPVLADHVARAEANQEMTKAGAVFIDRDPTHFGFILQYLRNRVEMLNHKETPSSTLSLAKFTQMNCQLPKDISREALRDLYNEATYYRIPELQQVLTKTGWFVNVMDVVGAENPFDMAIKWLTRVRNFLLTFGTVGGLGGTILVTMQQDFDALLKTLGLRKKDEEPKPAVG